jgi:lipopolysaccharide/colanic/teichoic acid biosynthesis glycosyltransferase
MNKTRNKFFDEGYIETPYDVNDDCQSLLTDFDVSPLYLFLKRCFDIVVSLSILLITSPLIVFVYFYIKKRSDGPPIFRQIRIKKDIRNFDNNRNLYFKHPDHGNVLPDQRRCNDAYRHLRKDARNANMDLYYKDKQTGKLIKSKRSYDLRGKPFVFYKFATMYPDAKQRFPELYKYQYSQDEIQKIRFKLDDDPRVPPWAKWLRKNSMDELLNFINVLKGDMSLVGPRPDIPEMLQYYTEHQQMLKLSVKPGITGFSQIKGRGDLTFQETLAYDLDYVEKKSFCLDLLILFETFVKLFTGKDEAY